jgi:AcrR family transcriptional regulator
VALPSSDAATSTKKRRAPGHPGSRSRQRYEERRDQIVDAAATVFAQRGYHATSIDDLVEAIGLKRGGLYHYVDSKRDLLLLIHERFIAPLLANAEEVLQRGLAPDETLRLLGRVLMNDIANYHDQVTVFLHEWRVIEKDPEWVEIRAARRRFEDLVGDVLAQGEQDGLFRFADRRIAVLGFLGMINYSYQWFRPGGRISPDAIADQLMSTYLDGIRLTA